MIDLNTVIVNSDGEPMKQNFKTKELDNYGRDKETSVYREIVLKDILKVSLLKTSQEDARYIERGKINDKSVSARYQLWKKMQSVNEINLSNKEKKLLKRLIYQHYELLVAGQVIEILK